MTSWARSPPTSTPSQKDYKVTPIYKGQYDESMTAAIAAYRAGNPPQIVQVFEVGTATMMAAKGAVKPVYQLMAEQKEPFDRKAFLGAVSSYYSDTSGHLISMPFNSSTQVLYVNNDAFKKAGLDPANPPKTWPEVEQAAAKLKASGARVRLHHRLAIVGAARKLQRLAQRAVRDPAERLRRPQHQARVQRSGAGQAHPEPGRLGEEGRVHLQGSQGRAAGGVHQRRVRR